MTCNLHYFYSHYLNLSLLLCESAVIPVPENLLSTWTPCHEESLLVSPCNLSPLESESQMAHQTYKDIIRNMRIYMLLKLKILFQENFTSS